MSDIQVLPIEHWFSDLQPDGSRLFLQPFGPETPEAVQYDPNVAPPELAMQPRQRDGIDFLRYLATSYDGDEVAIEVLLTEARQPSDLGPAFEPDGSGEFEEVLQDPDCLMVVYGLAGSVAQRQSGLWTPRGGLAHPTAYEARIHTAAERAGKEVANCDPKQNISGQPAGPAERAVADMGAKVLELGFDETDTEGMTQVAADVVYVDKLHWVQIPEVGHALMEERKRQRGPLRGVLKLFMPAESLDVVRKLDMVGAPVVEPSFVTVAAASPQNLAYADCMQQGYIGG